MRVEIKFCGMTRAEDVDEAAALGASYVGVIFAGGPRQVNVTRAREILRASTQTPRAPRTVGVFGDAPSDEIIAAAEQLGLDAVQLHGAPNARIVEVVRASSTAEVWAVVRVGGATLPSTTKELFDCADGIVLDAQVPGQLGGTGVALPWHSLAAQLALVRGAAKLIVAGGLRPENVAVAIGLLRPEVVDVSSGVETAPGIKDRARMRAFRDAVLGSQ